MQARPHQQTVTWLPVIAGLAATCLILAFGPRYGIFRDELYYWACARRLAWGYVDHPPFSIAVMRLMGDSLFMMKVPAAVAFGLSVFLTARTAGALGARRWGTMLVAVATGLCPLLAAIAGLFSMNVLEIVFWAVAAMVTARLLVEPSPALWVALGVVVGLGLLNKYSMFMFAAGLGVGLLLTPARRQLLAPWPWVAGFMAALLLSPHLLWEIRHGSPSLEFMRNATNFKMAAVAPLDFIKQQILVTNPVIAFFWLTGLLGSLFSARLAPWRAHGIAFLVSAAILIASGKSRAGYLAPSYMLVLPAGGVMFEHLVPEHLAWLRRAILILMTAAGLAMLPLALPILPVDDLIEYEHALGFAPRAEERTRLGPLPQFMADRFGWREMAGAVERAYLALPAEERARTWVFTRNYGEAAAIEYFSPLLRDRVLSGHNNYYIWFPQGWDGSEILVIGDSEEDVRKAFADVREVGTTDHPLAMPYERNLTIYLGRSPIQSLEEIRRAIKHYD